MMEVQTFVATANSFLNLLGSFFGIERDFQFPRNEISAEAKKTFLDPFSFTHTGRFFFVLAPP